MGFYTGPYGGVETGVAYFPNSSNPSNLTAFNGALLFTANDGVHGNELWEAPAGPSLAISATATTVSHTWTASGGYSVSVTATAAGLTSNPATAGPEIAPVSVTVEADPAKPGVEVLVVAGTATNENLVVAGNSGGVSLTYNGTALGTILPTNGETLALVEVFGGGTGNDVLDARGLSVSSVLVGGPANDTLYGGSGPNLLIGAAGADTLYAGSGGDILIGGTTNYDANTAANRKAVDYIMAEWGSSDSYSTRLKKLQSGGGLNGSYVLNSSTVADDNVIDVLNGGAGLDWFFAHNKGKKADQVFGLTSGEVITGI